jgi:lysophospholipase L1-like esterase
LSLKSANNENNGADRAHGHTENDRRYLEENLSNLTGILEFCKARSVRVVLVTTPTYHTYYDNLDAGQLGEMHSTIDSLKQQYHIEYYDYLKDTRFVADDFWDGDHLSDVGAEKFTKILKGDIW